MPPKYEDGSKKVTGHREAIRYKRPGLLSDGVIFLHGNIHIARKTQELLQKLEWEVWSHTHTLPNLDSKHPSGTMFSSNSDVKTAVESWLSGHGRDFYQAGLNKLVLRSDKCLNRFGDYVEK
ncbi:hypothetical protein AVEN_214242-1 [Araneus ventricosus]|uniref:Mariner Mos1 transposase n=1 Tax=Araneus ventricosus TaxID=182803 RepID=A0A4Y2U4T2_ARAVE|nr:hypothetical protein AVEN_214242-1 [Araneus ventricosus]